MYPMMGKFDRRGNPGEMRCHIIFSEIRCQPGFPRSVLTSSSGISPGSPERALDAGCIPASKENDEMRSGRQARCLNRRSDGPVRLAPRPVSLISTGISQMSVDLVIRNLARLSQTRIRHSRHPRVQGKSRIRSGRAVAKPEARPDDPTAPFGSGF
jgi:hypothetical protein